MNTFHDTINRRGTGSIKWDSHTGEELLHAWIADMDFKVPEPIEFALKERLNHPVFGYTFATEQIKETICQWTKSQYKWEIKKEWIVFSPGIVPALSVSVQAYTKEKDNVLVQPPAYPPFFEMVTTNNRNLLYNPLQLQNGTYKIDFEHLELQFQQGAKLMFLCSPHNPTGRVWTKEELTKLGSLCNMYDVTVVSDEIHADIIFANHTHTPFASLSEELANRTITCIAPSKTFNIAGLQASIIIIPNEELREHFTAVQYRQGFHGLNIFAYEAIASAYTKCNDWLDNLKGYIQENAAFATQFIETNIPKLTVIQPEGTFLLWIDCTKLRISKEERMKLLEEKGKIILEPGEKYGAGGEHFIRLNIGCPRSVLEDALHRLQRSFSSIQNGKKSVQS